ncbi:MAG: hypothetical protein P0116_14995 [Candidatus Nitrosocosmicus sp.]|nr:hypothetical protein [Candidatus Nitrosocosmicus sp.]
MIQKLNSKLKDSVEQERMVYKEIMVNPRISGSGIINIDILGPPSKSCKNNKHIWSKGV